MPDPHFHGTMLRYLERIPNALITGPSDAPLSIARLAQLLIESGDRISVCRNASSASGVVNCRTNTMPAEFATDATRSACI